MKNKDILLSLDLSKLLRILSASEELHVKDFNRISLINCFYKHRVTFWQKKVDEWLTTDNRLKKENAPEYIDLLLKLEYKNKKESLGKFTANSAEVIKYLADPQKPKNAKEKNTNTIIEKLVEESKIKKKIRKMHRNYRKRVDS